MHIYLHIASVSNGTICLAAYEYRIKRENHEKEIITLKLKFAQFNALVLIAYICTVMATIV